MKRADAKAAALDHIEEPEVLGGPQRAAQVLPRGTDTSVRQNKV